MVDKRSTVVESVRRQFRVITFRVRLIIVFPNRIVSALCIARASRVPDSLHYDAKW